MKRLTSFATAKKIIEVGMQDLEETKEVIRFNKENNNEYEIILDGNLLDSKNLLEYIKNGYVIQESWSDPLKLKHKDLIKQDEEEWDRFQQEHYGKKEGK